MHMTLAGIGHAVREKIVEGARPMEAAQVIAEQIVSGQNGRLRELHESGCLARLCQVAELDTLYAGALGQYMDDTQSPIALRTRYSAFHDDPLSVQIPIGNNGVRRAIGDLTRDDLKVLADYADTMIQGWKRTHATVMRVRKTLHADETVRDAWERISLEDQRWLLGSRRATITT